MFKVGNIVYFFIASFTLCTALSSSEAALIKVERRSNGFREQLAVIYKKNITTIAVNSNGFCGPAKTVGLGIFTFKTDTKGKSHQKLLKQVSKRLKRSTKRSPNPEWKHKNQYSINSRDITGKKLKKQAVNVKPIWCILAATLPMCPLYWLNLRKSWYWKTWKSCPIKLSGYQGLHSVDDVIK